MDYHELTVEAIRENLAPALLKLADIIEKNSVPLDTMQKSIEEFRVVFESIASFADIYRTAIVLSENQFVLNNIPDSIVNTSRTIDKIELAKECYTSPEQVDDVRIACNLENNRVFLQSLKAFNYELYDISIIGLTAVLDFVLSDYSNQIKNVRIKPRCEAIIQKLENKGFEYVDELEMKDSLILLTYPKAIELFGMDSDFSSDEPELLNRHWIMHGRTKKEYSRLDCVKVLNMIFGTIRMGQLGVQDVQESKEH